jgi:hypothetical protein
MPAGPKPDAYSPLDSLLTYLTDQYPDAPQVERAQVMLKLIEERRAGADSARADTTTQEPPAADTTTAAPEAIAQQKQPERDSLATARASRTPDTTRAPSSAQGAARADESEQSRTKQEERSPLPAPTSVGGQGDPQGNEASRRSIDRSRGGWTLLVQTFARSQEASNRVVEVGQQLGDQWVVELLREERDGETRYRLVVGQFQSERVATQARKRIAEQLSSPLEVWAIPEPE